MSEICGRVNRCDKFFGRYNIYPRAIEKHWSHTKSYDILTKDT